MSDTPKFEVIDRRKFKAVGASGGEEAGAGVAPCGAATGGERAQRRG